LRLELDTLLFFQTDMKLSACPSFVFKAFPTTALEKREEEEEERGSRRQYHVKKPEDVKRTETRTRAL
jgi:hypothetical protein